jgi:DNA invertase Pin-like site-specific DNA recombinase
MQDPTLSLPRQLRTSMASMPTNWVVVAHYYDIESGRKSLEQRGRGLGHQGFAIPIPRDGGIQDLLAAAARPDRRFAVVVCESIERVARRTYFGTKIEYELEQCGVALYAADEPMDPASGHRRSTSTLTRRVKQAVAEWYVLQMLELSWDGTVEHTHQGWNIGKPPYGYIAQEVPHPVPAKRAEGRTKHRLVLHPVQGPVVAQIFALRTSSRLGYDAIADELNHDLTLHPPPEPTLMSKRIGRWTGSAIREILTNPKYSGYMVYNRRSYKQNGGRRNPPEEWIWSPQQVHPALASMEQFDAALLVARDNWPGEVRSDGQNRDDASYPLRSHLWCELCWRRMWGNTHASGHVYYVCRKDRRQHADQPWYAQHPPAVRVPAEHIETMVEDFFATTAHMPLPTALGGLENAEATTLAPSGQGIDARSEASILRARQARLVEELEALNEHDLDQHARAMLRTDILQRHTHLSRLLSTCDGKSGFPVATPNQTREAAVRPVVGFALLPQSARRAVFEACQLRVSYLHPTRQVTIAATTRSEPVVAKLL